MVPLNLFEISDKFSSKILNVVSRPSPRLFEKLEMDSSRAADIISKLF